MKVGNINEGYFIFDYIDNHIYNCIVYLCIIMFLSIDVFFYFYSNIPMSIGLNEIKRSLRISIGVGIIMGIGFGMLYIKENKLK